MNDMSNTPQPDAGKPRGRIARALPVQTWGLQPTVDELKAGVSSVTVLWPQDKTLAIVMLECSDGNVVVSSHCRSAKGLYCFDIEATVASARELCLRNLIGLRDRWRAKHESRERDEQARRDSARPPRHERPEQFGGRTAERFDARSGNGGQRW